MPSLPKLAGLTSSSQGKNSCFLIKKAAWGSASSYESFSRSPVYRRCPGLGEKRMKEGASDKIVMVTITVMINVMIIGMAVI